MFTALQGHKPYAVFKLKHTHWTPQIARWLLYIQIMEYVYLQIHAQPREHHDNLTYSKQTSNHSNTTLHSIPYTTLYIKAWGVVDVKHLQKIHWEMQCTEEWNVCVH